jgi:hypothetical protein
MWNLKKMRVEWRLPEAWRAGEKGIRERMIDGY